MGDEDDIKTLIKKRGSVKSKFTNFQKFVDKLKLKKSIGDHIRESEVIELEERIEKVKNILEDFEPLQILIELLSVTKEEVEKQERERSSFEDCFYSNMAEAKSLFNELRPMPKSVEQVFINNSHQMQNNQGQDSVQVQGVVGGFEEGVKLPDIKLPTFNGTHEAWLEFRDLYTSLIHCNSKLREIQKFHYLRAALEGSALQVIKSLEFSAENYETAWELVKNRYENKKLLIHNHLEALFSLGKLDRNSANSSNLRKLVDTVSKHLRALETLKMPTKQWDILVIHIIKKCLDDGSLARWEEYRYKNEFPTLEDMYEFLKNRADLLERLEINRSEKGHFSGQKSKGKTLFSSSNSNNSIDNLKKCLVCSGEHLVYQCEKFQSLSVSERNEQIRKLKLCAKCLRAGHYTKNCRLYGGCKKCNSRKHNTLLHTDIDSQTNSSDKVTEVNHGNKSTDKKYADASTVTCHSSMVAFSFDQTLLSTAIVNVLNSEGTPFPVRVVLDSGSQSSYVTEFLCEKLGLHKQKIRFSVSGINNVISNLNYQCDIDLSSRYNNFKTKLKCLVIPEITGNLPNMLINHDSLSIPKDLQLADEYFYKPGPVDALIGADIFWNLLGHKQYSLGINNPVLQETQLGWIVSGKTSGSKQYNKTFCNLTQTTQNFDVQEQLAHFFEIEDVPNKGQWSVEEIECENHFVENTTRLSDGRFQVSIPFKNSVDSLGESFDQAKNRFATLERKFMKNEKFHKMYSDYIDSYKQLGQIRKVSLESEPAKICYYLPHHGVFREHSTSTKLRVVFDGSARTSTGISLNDLQMKGPVIQDDLLAILLRFRQYTYVVSGDIEKMYRQVRISDEQSSLQRMLWRDNPDEELEVYEMLTVTFGMTSSPFLAIRCLKELTKECRSEKPQISEIIEHDFYVDDLLTGFDSLETARESCVDIANVLASGNFPLRKWRTNAPEVLENLKSVGEYQSEELSFGDDDVTKTLGLIWSSTSDTLGYTINATNNSKVTKRTMLSCIAKLFDPLGLLSPCVILAKVMLQQLWKQDLCWDAEIPYNLKIPWNQFISELPCLNDLKIVRHVVCSNPVKIELHAFSDASDTAFGACAYIRSEGDKGEIFSHLLCSKTKVCPIKPITTPRAELCAAHVLAKLVNKIVISLRIKFDKFYYWTDSKILLGWINTSTNLLKPFVRNRVAEIQDLTNISSWHYVSTHENPADLLSRGVTPKNIFNMNLWWHGPDWLTKDQSLWPIHSEKGFENTELPELKTISESTSLIINSKNFNFPFENFSNLNRLKRCMAYILRFKNNCLARIKGQNRISNKILTASELDDALKTLVKISQHISFPEERRSLTNFETVDKKSKLFNLNPFLDEFGIIRVGGRLKNSNFHFNKKYPMVLAANHHLTRLIFKEEHIKLMHAGPQQTLFSVRENFWIISGRNLAKAVVHNCIRCYRFKTKIVEPIMGDLPKDRFTSGFPFQVSGLDYAGPFYISNKRGRGAKLLKGYVCLFICFASKAIHLELVSDLSTETFLLALKRFISRRGKPTHLFSDNGSNFVGANRELKEVQVFFEKHQDDIDDFVNNQGITWHFGPAYAPHFGGLWEAGIKAMKHHMKRVIGNSHCTGEEFSTLLCQTEAILNSRPLSPLSTDPLDPSPLTPAHFIMGRPISTLLEPDLSHLAQNRLSRYQKLEQFRQHLWNRWYKEFISDLQQRSKWQANHDSLSVGTLVLVKDDNLPPMNWKLGRVIKLFPGKDNVTHVCELLTANGIIKRNFTKICPLPNQDPLSVDKSHPCEEKDIPLKYVQG